MSHKILFVDDEPANLRILTRLFQEDHDVIVAESGLEALKLLNRHDVSLIVSDQRMPQMTGIEFLKKAAQKGSTCSQLRMLVSGSAFKLTHWLLPGRWLKSPIYRNRRYLNAVAGSPITPWRSPKLPVSTSKRSMSCT
jgi:CheY-like chemotaxis protein